MKAIRHVGSAAFVIGLFTAIFIGIPWYVVVADDPVLPWWFRTAVFLLLGGILVVLLTLAFEQKINKISAGEIPAAKEDTQVPMMNSTPHSRR